MQLNFPAYNFKIKTVENANYVFDIVRKKYVLLTPEEYVRQHLLLYLTMEGHFPVSLLAVEKGMVINGRNKRFDLMAYRNSGKPLIIAECKAPDIALTEDVLLQIAVYNSHFSCPFLLVTNGIQHLYLDLRDPASNHWKQGIPSYHQLTQDMR